MPAQKPRIVLGETDAERLAGVAKALENRQPEIAERILDEIDRADVVDDDSLPENVVRIGSTVTFEQEGGVGKTVTLVFPVDADIEAGRISVTTPIGTALLGMSPGQTGHWHDRNGRLQRLTVSAVSNNQDAVLAVALTTPREPTWG